MAGAVTILGRGPSWRECPFETPELWATATCLTTTGLEDKPYTKVFAFDQPDSELNTALARARQRQIPILTCERDYGTASYPLWEIIRKFHTSYLLNTISYMLAYALFLDYKRIDLYGIDQGPQWNYQDGKMHVCFWMGMATMANVQLRMGRGALRWAYQTGKDKLPEAFIIQANEQMANRIEHKGISNHIHPEEEVLCQQKS